MSNRPKRAPATPERRDPKPGVNAAEIPNARPAALPAFAEPSHPTLVDRAPKGAGWLHEVKFDGYRVQARVAGGRAALLTRNGLDWTHRFAGVSRALAELPVREALIDGEIVVLSPEGVADFPALVDALKHGTGNLVFYAFDLLHLDGYDLRQAPLVDRRAALSGILAAAGAGAPIVFSEHLEGDGDAVFRHACRLGLECIVSKKAMSPYRSGRTTLWVKRTCLMRRPFVVAGYVPSGAVRASIGSLVLGEHVEGRLVPSGHVGTGFTAAIAKAIFLRLEAMRTPEAPFRDPEAEDLALAGRRRAVPRPFG